MELPESHALLNPIHSIASFLNVLSNQSTMELLQERIRYQLEQCDAVNGVVVLEDISRGWCGTSILSDYLREEGVSSLFTVGVEDASVPDASVNGALSSFSSIEHSSIYTACNEDPSVTASCLDSVLSLSALFSCVITRCRQRDERRQVSFRQLTSRFVLGESRSLVHLSYGTQATVGREGTTVDCDWKECYASEDGVEKESTEDVKSHIVVWIWRCSEPQSIVSRQLDMDLNRKLFALNSAFVPNTLFHNAYPFLLYDETFTIGLSPTRCSFPFQLFVDCKQLVLPFFHIWNGTHRKATHSLLSDSPNRNRAYVSCWGMKSRKLLLFVCWLDARTRRRVFALWLLRRTIWNRGRNRCGIG